MASTQTNEQSVMLLESGSLTAHNLGDVEGSAGAGGGAEVRRGMSVQTGEGRTAGRLAAVVLDQEQQKVTHILLMREHQLLEYRLVPVELIEQVSEQEILLRIFQPAVNSLPVWHGADTEWIKVNFCAVEKAHLEPEQTIVGEEGYE